MTTCLSTSCEVCGLPLPREGGEPPPTTPPLPGVLEQCLSDHHLTRWQRWRQRRRYGYAPPPPDPRSPPMTTGHCSTHDFDGGFCIGPCPDRIPPWAEGNMPNIDTYLESERFVAGALSTMSPFATYHPAWALPFARQALDAFGEWEPST